VPSLITIVWFKYGKFVVVKLVIGLVTLGTEFTVILVQVLAIKLVL